jgi:hypothetical protein
MSSGLQGRQLDGGGGGLLASGLQASVGEVDDVLVPVGIGRLHRLDAQDPGPQLAVAGRIGGLHRRSTVGLGRVVVALGKRELGEDGNQVAELDIELVVLG